MPQARQTRQQKIQIAQRRQAKATDPNQSVPLVDPQALAVAKQDMASTFDMQTQDTYAYVSQELRRISWVSLVCLALLAIATFLLSPIPWIASFRQSFGL